jgi:hypothetical protein
MVSIGLHNGVFNVTERPVYYHSFKNLMNTNNAPASCAKVLLVPFANYADTPNPDADGMKSDPLSMNATVSVWKIGLVRAR